MSEGAPEAANILQGGYSAPGEKLEDLNKQYAPVSQQKRVPYWIRKGEMFGYIFRGWTMVDYLRNTSTPAPHEKREFKLGRKEGFENIITWGRQGTRKCLVGDTPILTWTGYKAMKNLAIGDSIITSSGLGRVLSVGKTKRPLLEVTTERRRIYSSPEHRFWTQRGWIQAQGLSGVDKVLRIDACSPDKTLDGRRDSRSEKMPRENYDYLRYSLRLGAVREISLPDGRETWGFKNNVAVALQTPKEAGLAQNSRTSRPSISCRNHRRRRDDNNRGHADRLSLSEAASNHLQHFERTHGLDSGIGELHSASVDAEDWTKPGDASIDSRMEGSRDSRPFVTLLENQESSSSTTNRLLGRQAKPEDRGRLHSRGHANLLEDSPSEFGQVRGWEEVQKVSRAGEEEELYDITTSTGHFIADGLVVHNSNLNRQMMYAVLGDWQTVLDYFLMTKRQIYDVYHMTTDEQVKVPYVTLDDITTTIPKQLFFVGMQEFIRFQQFIATIRLRIGIVGSNSPLPQNVISVLKDNISMEIVCFPNTTYMVERYCWFPHEFLPVTAYLRKVMIEYKSWDYLAEPEWVYQKYKEKRWVITEEIVKKLQGDDAEPEYIIPQVDMKEFEQRVRICKICKCFSSKPGSCMCANHIHDAVQISDAKLRDIVAVTLKTLQEKATTVNAHDPEDAVKVFG